MTDIEARTLYGSLRLLLLRTLEHGEQHGLEIRRHIEARAGEALRIEEGALYPALRRMEADGLVASRWAVSGQRRRARYYKLTAKGPAAPRAGARELARACPCGRACGPRAGRGAMKWSHRARGRDDDGVREIDEELRLRIEGRTEELIAAGHTPAEARRRALDAFGDYDAVRGEMRELEARVAWRRRAGAVLAESWRDVRLGARRLRRSPGHSIVATLTLALGIGASVAMFTVLNAVVLRPLPYPDSDRLVRVWPGGATTSRCHAPWANR